MLPSNFPQISVLNLAGLDSEVNKGLPLAGVIEHLHECRDVCIRGCKPKPAEFVQ